MLFLPWWIKARVIVIPCTIWATLGMKFVAIQVFDSLNPYWDFYRIFRKCFPQEDLELIRFQGISGNCFCIHAFLMLNFVGVPQPKATHGFSPNVQDMVN